MFYSAILASSRSQKFIATLRDDGLQDLADPGPVEANLAGDGAVAEAVGAKGKNRLTKLGFVRITVIGERRCGWGNSKAVEEMPSF